MKRKEPTTRMGIIKKPLQQLMSMLLLLLSVAVIIVPPQRTLGFVISQKHGRRRFLQQQQQHLLYPLLKTTTNYQHIKQRPYLLQLFESPSPEKKSKETSSSSSSSSSSRKNVSTNKKEMAATTTTTNYKPNQLQRHPGGNNNSNSRNNKKINASIEQNQKIQFLGRQGSGKWKDILILYQKESNQFNYINYATMMVQLGKIRSMDTGDTMFLQFLEDLATKIEDRGLDWIGIQGIANINHAIGRMGIRSNKDAKRIIQYTAKAEIARTIVSKGKSREVSNIVWGMAKVGDMNSYSSFFSHVEAQLERLVTDEDLAPQTLANMAHSCAGMGVLPKNLFAIIEKHSTWLLENGTPQAVANTAWAFATLGVRSPILMKAIEKHSTWLVENGTPQQVANTVWAFATLGIRSPILMKAIEKHSTWLVENGTPQEVANTAWAFATLGIRSPKLSKAIEKHSTWLVENGTPQEVANTAWAFATLGVRSPKLSKAIEKHSTWLVENGTPQAVANTAWAFATQGIPSKEFFRALMNKLNGFFEKASSSAILNVCYSIAILDLAIEYPEKFQMLWSKALSFEPNSIPTEECSQLVQSYLFVTAAGMKLRQPTIPSGISIDKLISPSQAEISELLTEIGFDHEQRVSPFIDNEVSSFLPEGMLAINFACPRRKIAIEFNGPRHYLVGLQDKERPYYLENGPTKAKRRFLERIGWKVYSIRHMDWENAKGGKQDLLRKTLDLN